MYLQLKEYFKQIAKQSIHINDSVGYFSREISQKESSMEGLKSPFLAIYDYELGIDGTEMNTIGRRKITFSIVFSDSEYDNFDLQQQKIDQAEKIAMIILSRIRWDNNQKNHFLYNSFEKDLTKIYPIEDPRLNFFGVDVEVHFKNKVDLKCNPDDWNNNFINC